MSLLMIQVWYSNRHRLRIKQNKTTHYMESHSDKYKRHAFEFRQKFPFFHWSACQFLGCARTCVINFWYLAWQIMTIALYRKRFCVWEFLTLGHEWTHTQHSSHDLAEKAILMCVAKQRAWAEERHKSGTSAPSTYNTQQCRTWPHRAALLWRRNNLSLLLQQWFSNKNGRPLFCHRMSACVCESEREKGEYRGRRKHLVLIEAGASAGRTKHITPILVPNGPNPHNIISVIRQTGSRRFYSHRFPFLHWLPLDIYKFSGGVGTFFSSPNTLLHIQINV